MQYSREKERGETLLKLPVYGPETELVVSAKLTMSWALPTGITIKSQLLYITCNAYSIYYTVGQHLEYE